VIRSKFPDYPEIKGVFMTRRIKKFQDEHGSRYEKVEPYKDWLTVKDVYRTPDGLVIEVE
jgi:hypothetical protein